MAQRVSTYMKNVAKSFGYALGDVFSDYNPVIISIGKEAKESATDMYDKIKSFSFQDQSLNEKSLKGQIKDSVNDIWKNFKDDIKSGNLYNKERQAKQDEAMMKAFGFDMDFDIDFDEDWGDDDSSSSNSASSIIEAEVNSTKQVITAVDQVGYKISGSISKTTAESADYIVSSANRSSRALYDLNMRGFNQISNSLVTINGTIASLAKIGEPLTSHMQNSAIFYTNTTQKLDSIYQSLQQVVKNTTPAPSANSKKTSSVKGTFSSIFSDDMGIDISQYKDLVKGNFAEYKDLVDMVVGFAKKGKGEGSSYGANISIAQMGLNKIVKTMLPEVFRESMKNFNESIKDALSGGILKLREKHSSNILVELLKDMFLPQDGFKSIINTSSYEKGVISWDGVSRKALTEVIPEALSLIYESMTGVSWVYNYDTGKFVFKESARKQQLEERQRYAREAGGQFRTSTLEKIDRSKKLSDAQKEKMKQEIESYFFEAFMKGEGFTDIFENSFNLQRFGLTPESLQFLQETIQENRKSKKFDTRHSHSKFVADVQKTRDRYGNTIREREAQGNDVTITLENGSLSISQAAKNNGVNINFDNASSNKAASTVRGEKTKTEANTFNNKVIDEDAARDKEREEHKKEAKKKVTNTYDKVKKFFSKDGFSEAYNRPFKAVADLLDKIGFSLEKLIWGGENDPEKGIMGYIFKKTEEVKDWFKRKLMEKFKTDNLTDALFGKKDEFGDRQGGFFSDTINQTKENLSKAGKWLGKTTGQFFKTGKVKVDKAAYGRKVTKSGIVAVSEGELIIPSEYNPFYNGITNKKQQVRNENNIVRNFYGSFADGGTVGEEQGFFERFKQNAKEFGKMKKGSKVTYSTEGEGAGFKFIREGFETLGSGVSKVFHNMFGSADKEQIEQDNKIIKNIAQKLMGEAKDNKGAMGAGALIGAGVSLATGAVVGPLFGAAIGAGAGLVVNSKTVQRILFGDVIDEETGEVSGGLLSKNVSNFMKQKVPSMTKGGAIGGIAGLFMGSPVMGALLGATTGYISSSEKAKTFIFGKVDENGNEIERGIIPKELQDKVKKAAPNIAAGSIAGLFVGPFGLAGNLIIGGGLGYLTSSQKFHDWMFGNKETGEEGLTKIFKEKIFDNLDEIFHNMGNAISGWSKNLIKETSSRLQDFFTRRAKAYENGEKQGLIGRLIGGTVSLTGKAIKGTTNFVGDRLGGINRRLKASNLSKGYGVYDKGKKRNLFASERVNARGGVGQGSGTFANFDELIANAGSVEELEQLRTQIQDAQDPNRIYRRNRNTALNNLYGSLQGLDPKKATKIAKMIEKGDPKSLNKIIKDLTPEEQAQYMPAINKALQEMGSAQQAKAKANSIQSSLKGMGIDISKSGASNNAIDLINYELQNNKKFSPEQLAEKKTEDWRERVINIFKSMDINIARLVKKETGEGTTAEADDNKVVEKTSIKDTLNKIDENSKTEIDAFGNIHQFEKNNQGEWEKVKNDSDTDESHAKMEKFMESVYHIPLIGKGIQSMTGFFGNIRDKLFGKKDDEDGGLLGKLFESSKGLLSFITGSKTGQTVKSILSSMSLKTVLGGIVAPALLAGGFGGKFDSIVSSIGNLPIFKGNDTKSAFDNNTSESIDGKTLTKDANGNYITNEKGEYQTTTGEFVSGNIKTSGSNTSFSAQLKKNLLTGIATGKGSVATATVKGAGKAWSKVLTKATGKEVVVNAASIGNGIMASITKLLENIPKILKAIPFLPNSVADGAEDIVTTLYTYLDDAVKAASSKVLGKVANVLSNALVVLKVVTVVGAGVDAWGNAETILGITEEATVGQRIIATLIAVANALIPVLGNLIPNKTLVNIFMKIAPKLGIDVSSLEEQRARAAAELDKYNKDNNTELTIEEYNQMNGKAGIITKTKNWGKSLFKNIKEKNTNKAPSGAGTKEGFGKTKDILVGAGSGNQGSFISQLDPKYKDMKFGNYTVGEKGCAPAVASMIANSYGKKLSMQDAVSASSRFQNKEGTSADYFQKVLNSRGINTNYMSGHNIPGQIIQTLANGEQVIILGRDANNQSKKNSPFGPNGHYVVATGIDRNGNIIINDPESNQPRVYDKKILTNARIGISTHASGSGTSSYDTETAKKVWGYFTSNGYSPAATAGIMGNLYSESGMNPAVIQSNGKGPAAGIAQWENYNTKSARWKGLYDYAVSRGYQWNELTPQLEFINKEMGGLESYFAKDKTISGYNIPATSVSSFKSSTDPHMAALQFEKAFERAGKPRMETRLAAAKEYYKLYHDSSYTGSYTPDAPNPNTVGMMSSGISSTESTSEEPVTFSTILSAIGTAFSKAFGAVVGRNDSVESTNYNTTSQSYAATPIDFSNVPEGKGNDLQKKIVQYANSRVGKNQYTQGPNRTKVDQGYSDCSSFAQWVYKQALGIDPGGYTGAQIKSPILTTVDSGTTPNKDRLEAGDLLFFRSNTNNGRYKNVGHVEIYDGNGNVIGHGSGVGPKVRNLDQYVKSRESYGGPYIEARRYTDIANASGGSSGLLLRANPGAKLYGKTTTLSIPKNKRVAKQFTGAGTNMVAETKNMLNTLKSDVTARGKSGSISADLVEKLLQAIIGILNTISNNTGSVDKIYQLLSDYLGKGNTPSSSSSSRTSNISNNNQIMGEVDVNIRSLVGTLAAIAKG